MKLSIVPHDASWKSKFVDESARIHQALGRNVVAVHHIGSTSIPDILAKPVIDILVEVSRIDDVDDHEGCMDDLSYESMGEYGINGRRYFRRSGPDGCRAFHVHVFESKSAYVLRHIAFRDFLLAHPDKAQEYSDLKARWISSGVSSSAEYQTSKSSFVEACVRDAIHWSNGQS